jgi:hypothetical protein
MTAPLPATGIPAETDIAQLRHLAQLFRKAIEACDPAHLPLAFQDFPNGACGDSTLLLGKFLEQNGYGDFDYVFGEQAGKSHAWLQKASLVVDITADQFHDNEHAVIVEHDSAWHRLFRIGLKYVADFENYDDCLRDEFRSTYRVIAARL